MQYTKIGVILDSRVFGFSLVFNKKHLHLRTINMWKVYVNYFMQYTEIIKIHNVYI